MKQQGNVTVTRSVMPPYEEYIEAIRPLWNTRWLTNMGRYHNELEKKLQDYLDVPELSLIVNGHMALELAIQSFAFPEGAEVITTPFTFISTTHAIVRNRLKPVFCDVKKNDGTIDESKIEELITENTVAIVPVHVFGHACNVETIQNIAEQHGLKVIYDAAHAFGVNYKGRGIGNYGDASIYSFHATKIFNTIEGGAVAFSDSEMREKLYNLKNFGIRNEEYVAEIGTNAKMNEFAAIMGLCNLKHAEEMYIKRKRNYELYRKLLANITGISILEGNSEASANYAYFPIVVGEEYRMNRDELYETLKKEGFLSRKYFYPLTLNQACFQNKFKQVNLESAEKLAKSILSLPFYADLDQTVIKYIAEIVAG